MNLVLCRQATLFIISILAILLIHQNASWSATAPLPPTSSYALIDDVTIDFVGATDSATKNNDIYYRQQISVTNSGDSGLNNFGVVWHDVISGTYFSYDRSQRWERNLEVNGVDYGLHWVKGYTYDPIDDPDGQNDYLSLPYILNTTDEYPVYWLGTLGAGEETIFNLYFSQNYSDYSDGGWGIDPVFSFISETTAVPAPAAIILLGSGLGILLYSKRRTWRYQ